MLLVDLPVEVLTIILDSIPFRTLKELGTLTLVNKKFLELVDKRLYSHIHMDFSDSCSTDRALTCLRNLAGRRSAAEAIRSISVRWCGQVAMAPSHEHNLFVDSLKHATGHLTLSLPSAPFGYFATSGFCPLFQSPKDLPSNFLPNLSTLNADTRHTIIQLVPHRPVHTVRIEAQGIRAYSIPDVVEALCLSTGPIQHLHFKIATPGPNSILQTLLEIVAPEKLRNLVTLDLQWECNSPLNLDLVID